MTACPRCTQPIAGRSARSRVTHNRNIPICTPCGSDEAQRDATGRPPVPPDEWPLTAGRN